MSLRGLLRASQSSRVLRRSSPFIRTLATASEPSQNEEKKGDEWKDVFRDLDGDEDGASTSTTTTILNDPNAGYAQESDFPGLLESNPDDIFPIEDVETYKAFFANDLHGAAATEAAGERLDRVDELIREIDDLVATKSSNAEPFTREYDEALREILLARTTEERKSWSDWKAYAIPRDQLLIEDTSLGELEISPKVHDKFIDVNKNAPFFARGARSLRARSRPDKSRGGLLRPCERRGSPSVRFVGPRLSDAVQKGQVEESSARGASPSL